MKKNIYKLFSGAGKTLAVLSLTAGAEVAQAQSTYTFNYTGAVQVMNLSAGDYSVECWGANGGDNLAANTGGKGGYSVGFFKVTSAGPHYFYVGGKGTTGLSLSPSAAGGFNGGGTAGAYSSSSGYGMGSGGGATHIASATGLLSTLSGNQSAVVVVAGGGGGSGSNHGGTTLMDLGGNGGGLTGGNGLTGNVTYGGLGGTQSAGGFGNMGNGMFGQGGNNSGNNTGGGGGGGWYGGGAAQWEGSGGGSGYIGGLTTGTTIAFGQPGFVPNPDNSGNGYLLLTRMCDVAVFAASNPICEGAAVTLSTNAGSSIVWSHGPTTASVSVSPQTTTSYSVSGVSSSTSACASTVVITVTVNPLPDISIVAFPQLVCEGGESELSANGANSFTWTAGPSSATMIATPQATSVYTVTGESIHGCIDTQTVEVQVYTNVISMPSSTSVCSGEAVTIFAGGLVTHTWSTGSHFNALVVSPGTNTVYTVSGHDPNGCKLNAMVSVNVASGPAVSITGNQQVCKGEPATLIASGADSYFWNTNETTETITQVLLVDVPHSFTVTGTGANGCTTTDVFTVLVSKCQSLNEEGAGRVSVFPNPTSGEVTIEMNSGEKAKVSVTDITGKLVLVTEVEGTRPAVDMSALDRGVYYLTVDSGSYRSTIRVIRQ